MSKEEIELIKTLVRLAIYNAIEVDTLAAVMVLHAPQAAQAIPETRKVMHVKWQPILDSVSQATPESLIALIPKLPVQ